MRVERISTPRINNYKSSGNYKCNQAMQFDSVSFGKKMTRQRSQASEKKF